MTSSESEIKEVVQRFQEEVIGQGKLELVDELFDEDFVGHSAAEPDDIHGPEEYKQFVAMIRSASSDMDVTVEDRIAEDDTVVQRVRVTGTHDGEFMGLEPTGNEFTITGIDFYRVEDGQIVEGWEQADMAGLMEQLGAP